MFATWLVFGFAVLNLAFLAYEMSMNILGLYFT